MEKIITYDTLRSFAYSNDKLIKGEIKGIVLDFYGLGGMHMHHSDPGDAVEYTENGILFVVPYYNPWCWMNKDAVDYTDEIIDVLAEKYSLSDNIKIASTGGSMGGLSALVYCAYAKRTPCACVTFPSILQSELTFRELCIAHSTAMRERLMTRLRAAHPYIL